MSTVRERARKYSENKLNKLIFTAEVPMEERKRATREYDYIQGAKSERKLLLEELVKYSCDNLFTAREKQVLLDLIEALNKLAEG